MAWQLLSRQTPASDPPHPGDGRARAPAGAGPRPPGAAGAGRAGARAPARGARSAWWCHPSPGWSTPPAPGLATKRRSHERVHHSSERKLARCPLPLHHASPLSASAHPSPPRAKAPSTSPGRLPTLDTWPGCAHSLPPGPTLRRISHNNNTSLHPNPAEASALSDIRGFEQDPKSSCAAARWTPRGRPPSPLPTRGLIENQRCPRNPCRLGRGAGRRVDTPRNKRAAFPVCLEMCYFYYL